MDFTFTEEQIQIRDSLRRFLTASYSLDRRRAIARSGSGCDPEIWQQFAELGILGLAIPQSLGGIGGDAFDALVVMEELGRALVIEPYLSTALVGAGILVRAGIRRSSSCSPRLPPEKSDSPSPTASPTRAGGWRRSRRVRSKRTRAGC